MAAGCANLQQRVWVTLSRLAALSLLYVTGPSIICELIVNLCIHGCCFSFFFLVLHSAGNVWIFCFIYWAFTHKSERLGRRLHIFGVSKWDFPAFAISNNLHSTGTEVCVCVYTWALSCIYHFNYLQMLMVVWKLGVMVQSQMTRLQLVTERCVWFVTCCTLWPLHTSLCSFNDCSVCPLSSPFYMLSVSVSLNCLYLWGFLKFLFGGDMCVGGVIIGVIGVWGMTNCVCGGCAG